MTDLFQIRSYWKQWVEVRIITERGAYAEGQVPEDYSGSELTVEVVQRIVFSDKAGHLTELRLDDLSGVMDAEGDAGIGADIYGDDGTIIETLDPTGPSEYKTRWLIRYSSHMPEVQRSKAAYVKQMADEQQTTEG